MNANEVIASRATEMLGGNPFGTEKPIHPNDHVNMGQSTNDMFPTAIHVAVAVEIRKQLIPGLETVGRRVGHKGEGLGQDHQDRPHAPGGRHAATTRARDSADWLGRSRFRSNGRSGLRRPCWNCRPAAPRSAPGINTHPEFGRRVAAALAKETGIPFVEAADHFEGNAQRDGLVECHGELQDYCVHVIQRGQQYPLVRIGAALRFL